MDSEERRNLWHTTLESVALPEEKLTGETNCWLTILMDWSLLHRIYTHKKATIARYRMLSTMKSIFINLNYTSIDLQNSLGPTLGFVSLDDSISAAVTIANRIVNTNQQYSIPLPVEVIYLYKDGCSEEIKTILTRSVRTIGLDIPVVGQLDYVSEKRLQDPRGIFYLNMKNSLPFAHVSEERLAPKSRFRPKEQIVYDGMHYVLLSTKTENSKTNMLGTGALAVHDYNVGVEITVWESEDSLRSYLSVVSSGTYVTMALIDLYSCETSKGIVYYSKFLSNLYSAYLNVAKEEKIVLVESFTLPYLVVEGEPRIYTIENLDLVFFIYGVSLKKEEIKVDVVPSTSIESKSENVVGQERVSVVPNADMQTFFSSGLAEILASISRLESTVCIMSSRIEDLTRSTQDTSTQRTSPTVEEIEVQATFVPTREPNIPTVEEIRLPSAPTHNIHFFNATDINNPGMSLSEIMKFLVPQPVHVQSRRTGVTENDLEAVNVFEQILEANSQSQSGIRVPSNISGAFAPIHLNIPDESDDEDESFISSVSNVISSIEDPDIVATTQNTIPDVVDANLQRLD